MPVHQFVHDAPCWRRACATTGATTRSASSPRTTPTLHRRRRASRCRSSRPWCATLHEAGIEVILDVVYNHTAEGNHLGPDAVASGASTTRPTTGSSTTTSATTWTTPAPGTALNVRAPARAAADHGLAALLGHRDARRRVPLRPRLHAGPRVLRRRPAVRLLRPRPAGPGRLPGQADRRAVGRRPGRLPGRQLPAAVDGVERQVPRHRPRLLARRARHARRVRLPADRLGRPLRGRRPPPGGLDQLRHRPRRLHPARPRLLQREAQRGQRRGQQRRRAPQPVLELRRRGRRPTTRRS